ncbi:uncharacterized protein LOC141649884 [Silene latifolia]|uniref:uncharacterized protein LOC141649884 n=1 Tax=Silene latifolia TaxID=37657 RepID=UPI003D7852D2
MLTNCHFEELALWGSLLYPGNKVRDGNSAVCHRARLNTVASLVYLPEAHTILETRLDWQTLLVYYAAVVTHECVVPMHLLLLNGMLGLRLQLVIVAVRRCMRGCLFDHGYAFRADTLLCAIFVPDFLVAVFFFQRKVRKPGIGRTLICVRL